MTTGSMAAGSIVAQPGGRSVVESYPQATSPTPERASVAASAGRQSPHPAVVRVIAAEPGGASLGSGTLVDANDEHGLVITNWHVVRDSPANVRVVFPDGFQSMGRVLRMDSNWDLAAILINKPPAAPVKVATDAPRVGDMLTIAGYGSGKYRAATGPCTQYLAPSMNSPFELVELAASARQGDSGGPIFNTSGELAGVLFGEGGGRTTGAYCRRVHNFLTLAVQQLHRAAGAQLASSQPKLPSANQSPAKPSSPNSQTEYFNPLAPTGATKVASTNSDPATGGWKRKPSTQSSDELVTGQPLASQYGTAPYGAAQFDTVQNDDAPPGQDLAADSDGAATASFQAPSRAQLGEATASSAADSVPVAAIGPSAAQMIESRQSQPAMVQSPQAAGASEHFLPRTPAAGALAGTSDAASAARSSAASAGAANAPLATSRDQANDWVAATEPTSAGPLPFAGDTLLEQCKSILACIGVAAFLFHGTRLLARTTSAAKGTRKRSKRTRRSSAALADA
jgi:hypothetical protein